MWKPYPELDFFDESIKQYHIDTRDFAFSYSSDESDKVDLHKCRKYPHVYYHTNEEARVLLERYFTESGGDVEWRMFSLTGSASFRTSGWQMKYIRILRFPLGLLFTISDNEGSYFIMGKPMLAEPIEQKYLNAH